METSPAVTLAFPLSIKAHVALRARLAAFMVLALLVTGMFNLRPVTPQGQMQSAAGLHAAHHRTVVTRARPDSQLRNTSRTRQVSRRGARYEEIHHSTATVAWPQLELGAPTRPRFFFRKLPSDAGSNADADAPSSSPEGYHSRAPPAMA